MRACVYILINKFEKTARAQYKIYTQQIERSPFVGKTTHTYDVDDDDDEMLCAAPCC